MEQKKKPTNAQLQKRINRATIMCERTKDTKEFYFSDKGLRLTADATEGYALIATGYHTHVFRSFTASGISRPYLYTLRIIDIAMENRAFIMTDDGYSYAKLLEHLKQEEDKTSYNLVTFYNWWLFNIFQPLYSIGTSELETFLVYEDYMHNIARNEILLSEHTEDLTNKCFIDRVVENLKSFTENIEEEVIFPKKSDEEIMKDEIEAIQQTEQEQAMEAQTDAN